MVSQPIRIAEARKYRYAQIPEPLLERADPRTRVYGWLDRRAGARGWWHDSARTIAKATDLGRATVQRALDVLVEMGLLARHNLPQQQTCYVLLERVSGPLAGHCTHQGGPLADHPAARQRATRADRTFIRSEEPDHESPAVQQPHLPEVGFMSFSQGANQEPDAVIVEAALHKLRDAVSMAPAGARDEALVRLWAGWIRPGDLDGLHQRVEQLRAAGTLSWPLLRRICGDAAGARQGGKPPVFYGVEAKPEPRDPSRPLQPKLPPGYFDRTKSWSYDG